MYAKVARFDYPSEWPSLFSDLMANLSSSSSALTVRRYALVESVVLSLHAGSRSCDPRMLECKERA
jgi:hypothetical protein